MKYQYKIVKFNEKGFAKGEVKWQQLEDQLNALGSEGWGIQDIQPLSVGSSQSGVVVFLKREMLR